MGSIAENAPEHDHIHDVSLAVGSSVHSGIDDEVLSMASSSQLESAEEHDDAVPLPSVNLEANFPGNHESIEPIAAGTAAIPLAGLSSEVSPSSASRLDDDLLALLTRPNPDFRSSQGDREAFAALVKSGQVVRMQMQYQSPEAAVQLYEHMVAEMDKLRTGGILHGYDRSSHEDIGAIPIEDLVAIRVLVTSSNELNQAIRDNDHVTLKRLGPFLKTAISGLNQLPRHDDAGRDRGWWPTPEYRPPLPQIVREANKTGNWSKGWHLANSQCLSTEQKKAVNAWWVAGYDEKVEDARARDILLGKLASFNQSSPMSGWWNSRQISAQRGARLGAEAIARYVPGQVVIEPAFFHTSLGESSYSDEDNYNAQYVIYNIETGKRLNQLSYYFGYADGDEVVFPPKTRFQVLAVEKDEESRSADEHGNYPRSTIYLYEMPWKEGEQDTAPHPTEVANDSSRN
ncbi:hypothetical protein D3870_20920 [Noviherbaspirillum cavernae]|uniref:ADP ribosyltransferase domain-containing protein n=1 Tax=Noviherbaspirillum cavernae TaxID=2320862 RepID=A0A418WW15_9BURK|nr:hypothetical protein D3870_20920 [Noviherbaspirillum cavernae]